MHVVVTTTSFVTEGYTVEPSDKTEYDYKFRWGNGKFLELEVKTATTSPDGRVTYHVGKEQIKPDRLFIFLAIEDGHEVYASVLMGSQLVNYLTQDVNDYVCLLYTSDAADE